MNAEDAPPITDLYVWLVTTADGGEVIMPFLGGAAFSPDRDKMEMEALIVLARSYARAHNATVRLQAFHQSAWLREFNSSGEERR